MKRQYKCEHSFSVKEKESQVSLYSHTTEYQQEYLTQYKLKLVLVGTGKYWPYKTTSFITVVVVYVVLSMPTALSPFL